MSKIDEILERLARMEAKQDAHLQVYEADKARIAKLEHTVNGNGGIGLAEELRTVKTKISWLVGGITLAVNALFQLAVKWGAK